MHKKSIATGLSKGSKYALDRLAVTLRRGKMQELGYAIEISSQVSPVLQISFAIMIRGK
jgi:hypothetical protein